MHSEPFESRDITQSPFQSSITAIPPIGDGRIAAAGTAPSVYSNDFIRIDSNSSLASSSNNHSLPSLAMQPWLNKRNVDAMIEVPWLSQKFSKNLTFPCSDLANGNNGVRSNDTNVFDFHPPGGWSSAITRDFCSESSPKLRDDPSRHGGKGLAQSCEPKITWHGSLPRKILIEAEYSVKVFVGGVPWDITELELLATFGIYGNVTVEWPGKDCDHSKHPPKGYVYLIFDSSDSVKKLLRNCTRSDDDKHYQLVSSRQQKNKKVQVIPWALNDSNSLRIASSRLDIDKTIFVGGLHGMLNADGLMHIMDDLFGGVVYAGIDTDQYKYPIGSGRVIFSNRKSYIKAVTAAFVEIRTKKFKKRIQLDPYLRDAMCTQCQKAPGPYFCRDTECWAYYCKACWNLRHYAAGLSDHRAMKRTSNKTKARPAAR